MKNKEHSEVNDFFACVVNYASEISDNVNELVQNEECDVIGELVACAIQGNELNLTDPRISDRATIERIGAEVAEWAK